jgi:predicted small lipoprotein YifL
MKPFIVILSVLMMLMSLSACGRRGDPTPLFAPKIQNQ